MDTYYEVLPEQINSEANRAYDVCQRYLTATGKVPIQ